MSNTTDVPATQQGWLRTYTFTRAAFSILWVIAAFALRQNPAIVAALLVAYPAWDAAANAVDAQRSGGLARNPIHAANLAVSILATLAVIAALLMDAGLVLTVFGVWAILSGLLQLGVAIRRWRSGAQWAMALSGAQSALAGGFFIAQGAVEQPITTIAGYAAFGALYFLISGIWLTVKLRRS